MEGVDEKTPPKISFFDKSQYQHPANKRLPKIDDNILITSRKILFILDLFYFICYINIFLLLFKLKLLFKILK